jgi:hypothetical protein
MIITDGFPEAADPTVEHGVTDPPALSDISALSS